MSPAKPPDDADWARAIGKLPSGDRSPFTTMTFTLTHAQAGDVKEALGRAKAAGPFGETGNGNGNGNALARIAASYE